MDRTHRRSGRILGAAIAVAYAALVVWLAQAGAGPVALGAFALAIGYVLWGVYALIPAPPDSALGR